MGSLDYARDDTRSATFSGQGVGTTVNTYTAIYNGAATKLSSDPIGGYTQSNTAVSSVTDAIKTPNTYYYIDTKPGYGYWSWYNFADISLWSDYGTNKSIYDPCPYGYRVPKSGEGTASSWYGFPSTKWTNSAVDGGAVWSNTWWPAAGCRNNYSGSLENFGVVGCYWSSSRPSNAYHSYYLYFDCFDIVGTSYANYTRSGAYPVRCVQEEGRALRAGPGTWDVGALTGSVN